MPVNNILIDSSDRSNGQPVNNFRISANTSFKSANISAIGLVEYSFQYLIPNINDTNNTFSVNVNATDYIITIPRGFYRFGHVNPPDALDPATYLGVLQAVLRAVTGEASFTVYPKLNATYPGLYTDPANDNRVYTITATPAFRIFNVGEGAAYTLGLSNMSVSATSYTSNVATMLYTAYVDIIADRVHSFNIADETSDTRSGNVLQRVYLGGSDLRGNEPEVITEQVHNPKWLKWQPSVNLGVLSFRLLDSFGNPLHIPADQDKLSFYLTFQAVDSDFNRVI